MSNGIAPISSAQEVFTEEGSECKEERIAEAVLSGQQAASWWAKIFKAQPLHDEGPKTLYEAIRIKAPLKVIQELIKAGAKPVNGSDIWSNTLYDAIKNKAPLEVIEALIEAGAEPSNDHFDNTLCEALEAQASLEVIKALIEAGAVASPYVDWATLENKVDQTSHASIGVWNQLLTILPREGADSLRLKINKRIEAETPKITRSIGESLLLAQRANASLNKLPKEIMDRLIEEAALASGAQKEYLPAPITY